MILNSGMMSNGSAGINEYVVADCYIQVQYITRQDKYAGSQFTTGINIRRECMILAKGIWSLNLL